MRVILSAVLAVLLSAPAMGQTPVSVDSAYAEALAATTTPLSVRRDQSYWLEDRAGDLSADDRAVRDENRIEELQYAVARDRGGAADRIGHVELAERCVDFQLMGCAVRMGGFLFDPNGDRSLYWQLQTGADPFRGITGGVVLLTPEGGRLRPAAWTFDGAQFDAPVVIDGDEDSTLIVAPGIHAGSGGGRADVVFRWAADGALVQIDNWTWRDGLSARLPEGLDVWQGVKIDYENMVALTPLWRRNDGNCCPTGGMAVLSFTLDGDVLVLDRVRATPAR